MDRGDFLIMPYGPLTLRFAFEHAVWKYAN